MADECDYAEIVNGGELGFECLRGGIGCAVAGRSDHGEGQVDADSGSQRDWSLDPENGALCSVSSASECPDGANSPIRRPARELLQ